MAENVLAPPGGYVLTSVTVHMEFQVCGEQQFSVGRIYQQLW